MGQHKGSIEQMAVAMRGRIASFTSFDVARRAAPLLTACMFTVGGSISLPAAAADNSIICSEEWTPYATKTDQGPEGIVVDILDQAFDRMGQNIAYVLKDFGDCISDVQSGKALAIASVSVGEQGLITGSVEIQYWLLTAFVDSAAPLRRYSDLDSLAGLRWLADPNYEYPDELETFAHWGGRVDQVMPQGQDGAKLAFDMLHDGRADIYFEDLVWGARMIERTKAQVRPLMPPLMADPQYVGFAPGNAAISDTLDQTFNAMLSDGTIDEIYKNWTGQSFRKLVRRFQTSTGK